MQNKIKQNIPCSVCNYVLKIVKRKKGSQYMYSPLTHSELIKPIHHSHWTSLPLKDTKPIFLSEHLCGNSN